MAMSTPVPVTPTGLTEPLTGTVSKPINPSAVAQQIPSAVFALGQVLRDLIHASKAYTSENQQLAAWNVVEAFMKAFVPASALPALLTGEERASVEDVTKRIPPQGVAFSVPTNVPVIDYDKLAAAMLRAQMAYNEQALAAAQESEPVSE